MSTARYYFSNSALKFISEPALTVTSRDRGRIAEIARDRNVIAVIGKANTYTLNPQ